MNYKQFLATFIVFSAAVNFSLAQSSMSDTYQLPTLYNDNNDGFTVIAHRGASDYYPENTMAAFEASVDMQAEMIELDVVLSKDGVPVVIHDARLNRTTDGTGMVSDYTVNELKERDAGSWFNSTFAGERLPTLEEVLQFAAGTIALNIEIKTESVTDQVTNGIEEKSLNLVKEYDMDNHVLFSSFDYRAVAHLKALAPNMPVAILYNKSQSNGLLPSELLDKYDADAFNCSYGQLTRRRLTDIKKHEIPVFIYTINEKRKMKKLIRSGVSGIFTNKPDVLRDVIRSLNQDS